MRTPGSTFLRAPRGGTEGAPVPESRSGGSGPQPGPDTRVRSSLNLARPWKFPAGHEDFILCRRHARSIVQIPVALTLYRRDGSTYDRGTGVIQDLSYVGLRLCDVFLTHGRLLAAYFAVDLRHAMDVPDGHDIAGRIVRTYSPGFPGFGIEFLFPGSGAEERLRTPRGRGASEAQAPVRRLPLAL